MALYGTTSIYGGVLYGNPEEFTELGTQTQGYLTAQESNIRKVTGRLVVNSHLVQYGRNVIDDNVLIGGTDQRRIAQSFISPKSFNLAKVGMLLKAGGADNTDDIKISITSGTAVGGSLVGSTTISALSNINSVWKTAEFDNPLGLISGSTYWITAQNNLDTTEENYASYDNIELGDFNSAVCVSGTWTNGTDYQYLSRLISETEIDNDKVIPEVKSFRLVRDRDNPSYQFNAVLINEDQKFSPAQSYSSYMEAGNNVRALIGFDVSGTTQFYQIFKGLTEWSPSNKSTAELSAKCYMSKLLGDYTTSGTLGGQAYENIIETVARRSGITNFDLRTTGQTSINPLLFENMTTADIAEKVREATLDRLHFKNNDTLISTERAKAQVGYSSNPRYDISHDNFLIDADIEVNTDKLINRITITNDEDGKYTLDGNPLTVGDYQIIGSGTYSLGSSVGTQGATISFTHSASLGYPTIYMDWSVDGTALKLTETSRSCGDYDTKGNLIFTLTNRNYGVSAGTATVTVYGCPIINAGTSTVMAEALSQSSYETYGKYSQRFDNRILANVSDANSMASAILSDTANPLNIIKANTKGIVDLFPDDIVRVYEPTRLKLDNFGIVRLCELSWESYPASFKTYLEIEKTEYRQDLAYLLLETGDFILLETGDKIYKW